MNGPMMMVLSLCGMWFICGVRIVPDGPLGEWRTWWKVLKFFTLGLGIYLFLFIVQALLYVEVVLKWLAF